MKQQTLRKILADNREVMAKRKRMTENGLRK